MFSVICHLFANARECIKIYGVGAIESGSRIGTKK